MLVSSEKHYCLREYPFSCDPGGSFIQNGFFYFSKENWKGTVRINLLSENSVPEIIDNALWPPFKILANHHFFLSSDGKTTKILSKTLETEGLLYFEEAQSFSNYIEIYYGLLFLGSCDKITVIDLATKRVLTTLKLAFPLVSIFPDNANIPLQLNSSSETVMDGLYFSPFLKFENETLRFFMKDPETSEICMGTLEFSEKKSK